MRTPAFILNEAWRTLTIALAAVLVYALFGPVPEALILDWTRPLAVESWRLWTAHLTHSDLPHLFWDVTGLILVGAIYEPLLGRRIWPLALLGAPAIDLAVIAMVPEVERYCGLSGLINLIVGAGLAAALRGDRDPLLVGFALLVALKVLYENLTSQALLTDTAWIALQQAHLAGFGAGLLQFPVSGRGKRGKKMRSNHLKRLRRVRLLAGLSEQELEAVATRGTVRSLRKNTVFIEHGDTSTTLYLILSGKVKVYMPDGRGNDEVLTVHGPGAHLGELALLTDAVRTASAATLEDSDLLALSRRDFIECLSACPQIAFNLDDSLEERALSPAIGGEVAAQYRAWSRFRHSGLPMIILIGGCTGTGKSTVAAELALRLDVGRIQSTDILRDVVRLFVSERLAPELHVSTYDAWRVLRCRDTDERNQGERLIAGFRAQSDKLAATVDAVIERSIKERESTIVEGIHMHPEYHRRITREGAVVIPFLLTNPSTETLKQHFVRRGETAPSRGASGYLENFSAIWQIQDYLVEEAKLHGVPCIPNTDLGDTLQSVIGGITKRLEKRFG